MKNKMYKRFKYPILIVSILILLSGCKKDDPDDKVKKFSAAVTGYGGDVTVEVTVADTGKIGTLKVDASKETPEIGGAAARRIAKTIVARQSLSVDTISGATITCSAVLNAAETALKQAGMDTEALKDK